MNEILSPMSSRVVFVEVHSTGKLGGNDVIGLHEAVIYRRKLEAAGESLVIERAWPEHIERSPIRMLGAEYQRLVAKHDKPNVVAVYGEPHTGRLKSVMDRIYLAYKKGIDILKIIELGNPNSDFIQIDGDGIEPPRGLKVPRREPTDHDLAKPMMSDADDEVGSDNVKSIDDVAEDNENVLDGNLVNYLESIGWLQPDALSVARLVRDNGIKNISDEALKTVRSLAKADARKRIRLHLADYDPKIAITL